MIVKLKGKYSQVTSPVMDHPQ